MLLPELRDAFQVLAEKHPDLTAEWWVPEHQAETEDGYWDIHGADDVAVDRFYLLAKEAEALLEQHFASMPQVLVCERCGRR
jgi:hypothetical protein